MRITVFATALWLSVIGLSAAADADAAIRRNTNISPQSLVSALNIVAKDRDLQVVYRSEVVGALQTQGAIGEFTANEVFKALLRGTGLTYRYLDEKTVTIIPLPRASDQSTSAVTNSSGFRVAQAQEAPESPPEATKSNDRNETAPVSPTDAKVEEVVVTGTHIRGVTNPTSPMVIITQEEMRLSGHTDLGQVVRALPQSFPGGQNPEVGPDAGASGVANQNITGASSLNLRGLGPDATLTLLNGVRLPYDGFAQATDVAVIPVAAIDRLEVLLDGASAVYGSDAVGGVANIVLKRDYSGVEISTRYGAATDGGNTQARYTGLAGHTWDEGGFLVTADFSRNTAVKAEDRDYLGYLPASNAIYPGIERQSGLFSGHQKLSDLGELTLDMFYTESQQDIFTQNPSFANTMRHSGNTIWGISSALRFNLPGEWSLRVHGSAGRNESKYSDSFADIVTGDVLFASHGCYCNKAEALGAEADGPAFSLPAGLVRVSIGGGYLKNSTVTGSLTAKRRSYYSFGEINVPLIAPDQGIRGVSSLSLNGSVRHEDYGSHDFGTVTTPKIGLLWGISPGVDLKASWGRSFKAPTLGQQYEAEYLALVPATDLGAVGAPPGATALYVTGGNPNLDPERAKVFTTAIAVHPQFLPGLDFELSWFHIDYLDRTVSPLPSIGAALSNPVFAEFVTRDPTVEQQNAVIIAAAPVFDNFTGDEYEPTQVVAIANNQYVNAASQKAQGFDFSTRYETRLLDGRFTVSGIASWLEGRRRLSSLAPQFPTAGVLYFPAKFRGRIGFSWSRNALTLSSNVNYIGAVKDTNSTPNPPGSSMTTADLVLDYQLDSDSVGDVGFNLAVTNLLNERPPFLRPINAIWVNYDSTNYSAIGRVLSATVTKRW